MTGPVLIAAGGTGGHFFPAEALAGELLRRGLRVALMTDARSAGLTSPAFAQAERFVLSGGGLAGRGLLRALKGGLGLLRGIAQARALLKRLRPAAIIGFGGYPSVGPIVAARLFSRRPPVLLHEQNAVLGRANRALLGSADILALGMAQTSRIPPGTRTEVTGNPVRPALAALSGQGYAPPAGGINLLVLGGSQGARVFSDIIPAALASLPAALRARLSITQQCRPEDLERVRAAYAAAGLNADLAAFFPDVAARLSAAHLVIARAGASTVAELAVAGRPSILVPLPGAIDDHQSANAAALPGAIVIAQRDFTAQTLAATLASLLTESTRLAEAAAAAAAAGHPDAAARLADLIERQMDQAA